MGTLDYMPPEQFIDARNVDERGDIYSLGCTLYRLLTGQRPFPADTVGAIFKAHRGAPVPRLRSVRPEIPDHLDQVYQRMLAKEPDQRQSSMALVIEQLEESLTAMQSPQAIAAGELHRESTAHSLDAVVAARATPPGSPQIVLTDDQPIRRRGRNQWGWVLVGGLACSLLMLSALLVAQRFGRGASGPVSAANANRPVNAIDMPAAERMTEQPRRGNPEGRLQPNREDNVDRRSNRPQRIGGDQPQAITVGEDSRNAEPQRGEQRSRDAAAGNVAPHGSAQEPRAGDSPSAQSNRNDVVINEGKPLDWIGHTTWSGGFGFQEGSAFNPTANRRVEFNDNGRKISISENSGGITMSVDGRVIEAASPEELSKRDAEAYQLYQKMFDALPEASPLSPLDLQREQLNRLRKQHSGNRQMQLLIEKMLRNQGK